jgi:Tfp pilus assembly protein PilF
LETLQGAAAPDRKRWWLAAAAVAVLAVAGVYAWQHQKPQTAARTLSTGGKPSASREANEVFELSIVQLQQGNTPRAQELLQRAVTLDPRFAAARQFLGTTYMLQILQGQSNDSSLLYKADEDFRLAAKEDPSQADIHGELAGVAFLLGDKQRALAEINQSLALDPLSQNGRQWRLNLDHAEENAGQGTRAEHTGA